jgi:PAS domain S-box-containing protein
MNATPSSFSVLPDFELMVRQLRENLGALETSVSNRSRDLQLAAEVSQQIASVLSIEELLPQIVERTRAAYNLYYVQVYLLDPHNQSLALAAGSGDAGVILKQRGHEIPIVHERSLVARAARELEPVVANDARANPDFLPNPVLPETRAELVVPIIAGDIVIGVLDAQASQVGHFTPEDVQVKTALASQIAVALQNAQAFDELRRGREQQQQILQISDQLVNAHDFDHLLQAYAEPLLRDAHGVAILALYDSPSVHQPETVTFNAVYSTSPSLEIARVGQRLRLDSFELGERVFGRKDRWMMISDAQTNDLTRDDSKLQRSLTQTGITSITSIPLVVSGSWLGQVLVLYQDGFHFTEAERTLYEVITPQMASLVDNRRLVFEANDQSQFMSRLFNVSAGLSRAHTEQELVELIRPLVSPNTRSLNLSTWNTLDINTAETVTIVYDSNLVPEQSTTGTSFPREIFQPVIDMVTDAMGNRRTVSINDIPNAPEVGESARMAFASLSMASGIFLPLLSGERWFGTLMINNDVPHVWSDDEVRLLVAISDLLATAYDRILTNRRSENLAQNLQVVMDVTNAISSVTDLDGLLSQVVERVKSAFNLYHAHIYLLNEEQTSLELAAGAGEAGRMMKSRGHKIAANRQNSLVATAASQARTVVVNDVTEEVNFLPNPLLPETAAEMSLPLIARNRVLGVLDVQSDIINRFSGQEVQVLETLAKNISIAIENAFEFTQVKLQSEAAETLAQLNAYLTSAVNKVEIVNAIADFASITHATHIFLDFIDVEIHDTPTQLRTVATWDHGTTTLIPEDEHVYVDLSNYPMSAMWIEHPNDAIFVEDVENHPIIKQDKRFSEMAKRVGNKAMVIVPLQSAGAWQGVLTIIWDTARHFSATEKYIFSSLAQTAASSVATRRLILTTQKVNRLMEHRAAQLEAVTEVSRAVTNVLDLDELLLEVVNATNKAFDLYHTHIYLLNDSGTDLELAVGVGEAGRTMKMRGHKIPLARENSIVARSARERMGLMINDVRSAQDFLPNPLLPDTASELAVPILLAGELYGVLDVQADRQHAFEQTDLDVLTTLASQIAISIENARALRQILLHERAIENSTSGLTIADASLPDMPLVYINPAFEHITGYTVEEAMNRNCRFLQGTDNDQEGLVELRAAIREGRDCTVTLRNYKKDGTLFYNELRMSPIHDRTGKLTHYVGVQTDITERMSLELERNTLLQIAQEQAEQERITAERLREVDRLKSQFLANMSHELRTPLNSIIGYSEVLLDGDDGDLSEDAETDIEIIYDSGRHLLAIINDILDLAKIESGQMRMDRLPISLAALVGDASHAANVLLKEKPVTLSIAPSVQDVTVLADSLRLRQIVMNLLSNAIKFTEKGTVTLAYGIENDTSAYIEVRDTGIGMKADDLQVIFEEFRQVDGSSTRRAGGTGLGLTITRHLINLHGGEINVTSEYGVGSCFRFTLPLAGETAPAGTD